MINPGAWYLAFPGIIEQSDSLLEEEESVVESLLVVSDDRTVEGDEEPDSGGAG